ncbi:hypothetical protein B0H11DRAFT_1751866 [Mycena galericulata]|nr:hypothetical protein B0H11DRAFT_1751866 [Mycena galericulata]
MWEDPTKLCASVPLRILIPDVTKPTLKTLCDLHKVRRVEKNTSAELIKKLANHTCKTCPNIVQVFNVEARNAEKATRDSRRRKAESRLKLKGPTKKSSRALCEKKKVNRRKNELKRRNVSVAQSRFPPEPPTQATRHRIISGICADLQPGSIEESGCAVCGQLTPNYELTKKTDLDLDWNLLKRSGVTRLERASLDDPIQELAGPIMADECDDVCADCELRLMRGSVPTNSLSNHHRTMSMQNFRPVGSPQLSQYPKFSLPKLVILMARKVAHIVILPCTYCTPGLDIDGGGI